MTYVKHLPGNIPFPKIEFLECCEYNKNNEETDTRASMEEFLHSSNAEDNRQGVIDQLHILKSKIEKSEDNSNFDGYNNDNCINDNGINENGIIDSMNEFNLDIVDKDNDKNEKIVDNEDNKDNEDNEDNELYWSYTREEIEYVENHLTSHEKAVLSQFIYRVASTYFNNGYIVRRLLNNDIHGKRKCEVYGENVENAEKVEILEKAKRVESVENREACLNPASQKNRDAIESNICKCQHCYDPNLSFDVFNLCRFLRANQFQLKKAENQLSLHIKYRLKVNPYHITPASFPSRMNVEPVGWWQGRDRSSTPFFVIRPQFYDKKSSVLEEIMLQFYFTAENVISKSNPNNDLYSVMFDARHVTWNMMDFRLMTRFSTLNDYYPERLKKLYIIKPGWLFSGIIYTAKKIMNPKTMSKLVTVNEFEQLHEDFELDQLPNCFGGTSTYNFSNDHLWLEHEISAFDLTEADLQRETNLRKL